MKRLLFFSVLCLAIMTTANGQKDILEGLFDKEKPDFHATILPTEEEGTVKVAFYFTHSSLSTLEASFWIKDQGANLMKNGRKELVHGLKKYGNRQQDTLLFKGLQNQHFYTIGIDYRNPAAFSKKFESKILKEGYHYTFRKEEQAAREPQMQRTEPRPLAPESTPAPCEDPNLFVRVEPSGYCSGNSSPAVLIQCEDCQGRPWEFSVEVRTEYGQWAPLRADGLRQKAAGMALRTEPLCTLAPGNYYLRVLAWGENCSRPIIQTIGSPINISAEPLPGEAEKETFAAAPQGPVANKNLPDTCIVESEAILEGNRISGFIELDAESPCADHRPFARVSYIHPGYRDIDLGELALVPGEDIPFSLELDSRDLSRGIHPVQVIVFLQPEGSGRTIPVSSFLVNAAPAAPYAAPGAAPEEPGFDHSPGRDDRVAMRGIGESAGQPGSTANCPGIEGLQLIYVPDRPNQPLYIAWSNPDCCAASGCEYEVWAGQSPEEVKLQVKGRKSGAQIRELIQGIEPGTQYFEVRVNSPEGLRMAAYIPGKGPRYGQEEVMGSREQFEPREQENLPVVNSGGPQVGGGLASRMGRGSVVARSPAAVAPQPQLPVSKFEACRIYRETRIIAQKPIQDGDRVTIEYDYADKAYKYTLYHLPDNGTDWVVAAGTQELQDRPVFEIQAQPYHSGKYLILAYKPESGWGCLSAPVSDPIEITVLR